MARGNKAKKSAHLKQLEETFDRHTRRFSPFDVLGLRGGDTKENESSTLEEIAPTHTPVDDTHPHSGPTRVGVGTTHPHVDDTHTRVVVKNKNTTTTKKTPTGGWVPPTHPQVGDTSPRDDALDPPFFPTADHADIESPPSGMDQTAQTVGANRTDVRMQDVLAATQIRTQLGKKARQVLGYLNALRSVEHPAFTVPVGYAQLSAAANVHQHYLRRDVLPKLAMLGLIGIAHKTLQGTTYHLQYDPTFVQIVVGEQENLTTDKLPLVPPEFSHIASRSTAQEDTLPDWVDRERWGWLAPEVIQQLVAKAGSEVQAREKLDIIWYNETHGPAERRVRDRRAVLAHYLRMPHADIWPNDEGYETLSVRQARLERDRALQEKTLAEEALRARQEATRARFLASLEDTQLRWLKQQAKKRVDARPDGKFLASRYPLYKAEEEEVISEWMDRVDYGEIVPHSLIDHTEEPVS